MTVLSCLATAAGVGIVGWIAWRLASIRVPSLHAIAITECVGGPADGAWFLADGWPRQGQEHRRTYSSGIVAVYLFYGRRWVFQGWEEIHSLNSTSNLTTPAKLADDQCKGR